jgi:hypothetical protein
MSQGNFMSEKKRKIVKGYIGPLLPTTEHEIIESDRIAR